MKKTALLFLLAFGFIQTFSQNDLVIFSEQGERFFVIVNGIRQNAKPETNVKVTGLKQPMVTAKIIFEDKKIPDLDQKIYFSWAGEEKNGWEFTYAIINKKGEYKLRGRSAAEITQAPAPQGQTVVVYTTTPPPAETTTISTTTTTTSSGTTSGASVGMNANGTGMNVNVSINDGTGASTSQTTVTSTTTTATTSSSSPGSGMHPTDPVYVLPGYNGPVGCPMPMGDGDFSSARQSIGSKSFEDSKLTMAKQVINGNCLLCSQVKEIMLLFSFEQTRLDLAKYAYKRTYDPGNYYKLNDAFTFESSIDELNSYIEKNK